MGPSDDTLFGAPSEEERCNQKFDDMFIGSELTRLDFFYRRRVNARAYQAYYDTCKIAAVGSANDRESCEVLENAISNLIYSNRYPLPLDLRAAILAEKQKRAGTPEPIFTTERSISPEVEEEYRRNAEYVKVHFPGVSVTDVHTRQEERFYKARHKHPKLRGQVEIDFLNGSIEEREKILDDAENLPAGPPDHFRRLAEPEKQKRTAAPAPTSSNVYSLRVISVMERKIQELEGKLSAALDRVAELEGSNKDGKPRAELEEKGENLTTTPLPKAKAASSGCGN